VGLAARLVGPEPGSGLRAVRVRPLRRALPSASPGS